MSARRDALQSQLVSFAEMKDLFAKEVESLRNKMATQDKQIGLARRELKNIGTLVEKGLAVNSREFNLQQTVADLESKLLDLETASLRAQQEIRKAERDAADLQKDRRAKIAAELQDTLAIIEQLTAKLNTSNALVDEAAVTAPRLALERSSVGTRSPIFSILRRSDGKPHEMHAEEHTLLQPGDVLRIEMTTDSTRLGNLRPAEAERAGALTED
ncbi:MAG: hypothetical protein HC829_00120 [Bacteroidales bacterium]|nr:hypothetical protein [Bacteroidales bacterium]